MLQPGTPIPRLVARDANGSPVSLEAWHGKRLVLYFYPKDDTPGCTVEACSFRDNWELIRARGAEVVGVSPDPVAAHEAFARKYDLPFTLLSDTEGVLAQAFGTAVEQQWAGKTFSSVSRTTFLIDEAGVVRHVWDQVDPRAHVQEVVDVLDTLTEARPSVPHPEGPVDREQVLAVLDTLRPFMRADGGDVELVGIDEGVVKLRLQGACGTCPSSTITLRMGLEAQLKQRVPGIKAVEAV